MGRNVTRDYTLPNQVHLSIEDNSLKSSFEQARHSRQEQSTKIHSEEYKRAMLKTNLMSKKYITNLLEQDNLYKDGDYSDVFIN